MSTGLAIVILVLLLLGNAFFVAAEFAMVSARRDQIEPRAARGSRAARFALKGIEDVSTSLAASQLGITACSLVIGAVGEPAIAHLLEGPMRALGIPGELTHPIALVIALLIITFLHMVLGEMVPKNMAIARPAAAALLLGPVLHLFVVVLRPFIWLMNTTANFVVRHVLKAEPRAEVASAFTAEEVAGFVEESGQEGLLGPHQIELLTGALDFEHLTTADVAIPAEQLHTVPATATVAEVEQLCAETGFSRFPVRDENGNLVSYLHVKDLLGIPGERRNDPVPPEYFHELITVPTEAKLQQVMRGMQLHNAHLALVQSTGTKAGEASVVAFEDVLEELVGEVRDATSAPS
jgi:CBS domain containing-hemolysin-like protein